jgi:hypothetical protein
MKSINHKGRKVGAKNTKKFSSIPKYDQKAEKIIKNCHRVPIAIGTRRRHRETLSYFFQTIIPAATVSFVPSSINIILPVILFFL